MGGPAPTGARTWQDLGLVPRGNDRREVGVGREELDEFAAESHCRAAAAQRNGWTRCEIFPIALFPISYMASKGLYRYQV